MIPSLPDTGQEWPFHAFPKPTVAALYVQTGGCYFDLPGVEPWDQERDARKYDGPWPVVAHPPCQRWGKMWAGSPFVIARDGIRKVKGDDGGCFAAALAAVRKWGGVIEHPRGSHAWAHFGINKPPSSGGWVSAGLCGGWTCCIEQGRYGHYARKPTWLLVYGVPLGELPDLDWGESEPRIPQWAIDKYGEKRARRIGELSFKGGGTDSAPRIGTPEQFRELLLSIARSVRPEDEQDWRRSILSGIAFGPGSHPSGRACSPGASRISR